MKICFRSPEHENLYRQTPSIWLQTSVGLAAWLWLAPGAEAQPTYTPIPLDNPTPQADARFAEAAAGIGDVNGDGVTDLLVGAPFFSAAPIEASSSPSITPRPRGLPCLAPRSPGLEM